MACSCTKSAPKQTKQVTNKAVQPVRTVKAGSRRVIKRGLHYL